MESIRQSARCGAGTGTPHAVFCLSGRYSQSDLYDQCGGIAQYVTAESDQDPRLIPESGGRHEAVVPGPGAYRQKMDQAGTGLEGGITTLRHIARRPLSETRTAQINRQRMKNRKKNIFGMGALPHKR